MSDGDFVSGIMAGGFVVLILTTILLSVYTYPWWAEEDAEFFCNSIDKEVQSFKFEAGMLLEVVCGPKRESNPDVTVFRVNEGVSG